MLCESPRMVAFGLGVVVSERQNAKKPSDEFDEELE